MDNSLELLNNISERMIQINDNQIKLSEKIQNHSSRLSDIEEMLEKRVYITAGEMLQIKRHIKSAVTSIAQREGWQYSKVSRSLFSAIYSDINDQYDVPSYHDLPSKYFTNIISKIDHWSPDQLMRDKLSKLLTERND